MAHYALNAKDLSSRDVVSRAMTMEVREGRGVTRSARKLMVATVGLGASHMLVGADDLDAKIKFTAEETLRGVGGLVFNTYRDRFCQ